MYTSPSYLCFLHLAIWAVVPYLSLSLILPPCFGLPPDTEQDTQPNLGCLHSLRGSSSSRDIQSTSEAHTHPTRSPSHESITAGHPTSTRRTPKETSTGTPGSLQHQGILTASSGPKTSDPSGKSTITNKTSTGHHAGSQTTTHKSSSSLLATGIASSCNNNEISTNVAIWSSYSVRWPVTASIMPLIQTPGSILHVQHSFGCRGITNWGYSQWYQSRSR